MTSTRQVSVELWHAYVIYIKPSINGKLQQVKHNLSMTGKGLNETISAACCIVCLRIKYRTLVERYWL